VDIHVTTTRHAEFRKYETPGAKQQLVEIMGYMSFYQKRLHDFLTKKEYITVKLTSRVQCQ